MSESFKQILRTKSAEQLSNMFSNRDGWSEEEHKMIKEEISNRGLEIFEEPEEWSDEVMEDVDLLNPTSDFEHNLAYLTEEKKVEEAQKGLRLASQIVSISSILIAFAFFYWYQVFVVVYGLSLVMQLTMTSILLGIIGLVLFILRKYVPSLVVSSISLAITTFALVRSLEYMI